MNQIIIFLIGVLVGGLLVWFSKKGSSTPVSEYNKEAGERKEGRKEKILSLVRQRGEVSNNDIEELLSVSDATATNYLQELKDEGKIEQIGTEGRSVKYKLK